MIPGKRAGDWFGLSLLILPAVHVSLIVLTILLSLNTPGGAYYRLLGVDVLAAPVLMVNENPIIINAVFLIFGTAWWYFIAKIGWASNNGRMTRLGSGLGALLALTFAVIGTGMSRDVLYEDFDAGQLSVPVILQYALIAAICFGAFISAIYSIVAVVRPKRLADRT
jgi:hypothetical protein